MSFSISDEVSSFYINDNPLKQKKQSFPTLEQNKEASEPKFLLSSSNKSKENLIVLSNPNLFTEPLKQYTAPKTNSNYFYSSFRKRIKSKHMKLSQDSFNQIALKKPSVNQHQGSFSNSYQLYIEGLKKRKEKDRQMRNHQAHTQPQIALKINTDSVNSKQSDLKRKPYEAIMLSEADNKQKKNNPVAIHYHSLRDLLNSLIIEIAVFNQKHKFISMEKVINLLQEEYDAYSNAMNVQSANAIDQLKTPPPQRKDEEKTHGEVNQMCSVLSFIKDNKMNMNADEFKALYQLRRYFLPSNSLKPQQEKEVNDEEKDKEERLKRSKTFIQQNEAKADMLPFELEPSVSLRSLLFILMTNKNVSSSMANQIRQFLRIEEQGTDKMINESTRDSRSMPKNSSMTETKLLDKRRMLYKGIIKEQRRLSHHQSINEQKNIETVINLKKKSISISRNLNAYTQSNQLQFSKPIQMRNKDKSSLLRDETRNEMSVQQKAVIIKPTHRKVSTEVNITQQEKKSEKSSTDTKLQLNQLSPGIATKAIRKEYAVKPRSKDKKRKKRNKMSLNHQIVEKRPQEKPKRLIEKNADLPLIQGSVNFQSSHSFHKAFSPPSIPSSDQLNNNTSPENKQPKLQPAEALALPKEVLSKASQKTEPLDKNCSSISSNDTKHIKQVTQLIEDHENAKILTQVLRQHQPSFSFTYRPSPSIRTKLTKKSLLKCFNASKPQLALNAIDFDKTEDADDSLMLSEELHKNIQLTHKQDNPSNEINKKAIMRLKRKLDTLQAAKKQNEIKSNAESSIQRNLNDIRLNAKEERLNHFVLALNKYRTKQKEIHQRLERRNKAVSPLF